MHHRRPTAIAALLLALTASLSACGFHYPTDRVNIIAAGANNREAPVKALGIRVLSDAEGSGRLIGTLANDDPETASLDSVTDPDGGLTAGTFKPVKVESGASVNLADLEQAPAVPLTGEFAAGDVVNLQLGFSTGDTVTLSVPVVKHCWQYADIEMPSESAATEGASAGASDDATDESVGGSVADGATEGEDGGGTAAYDCTQEATEGEGH